MRNDLRLHVWAHLKFFLRNRLILGLILAAGAFQLIGILMSLMYESSGSRFNRLNVLSSQLHGLIWLYGGLLALLAMWSHLRDRSTRLIFVRPIRPEVWIASVFVSAVLVTAAAHVLVGAMTAALSFAWGIPYQTGFVWLAIDRIFESVIIVALVAALGVAVHPVLAVMSLVFFSEETIYYFYVTLTAANQREDASLWVDLGQRVAAAVYTVVPMLNPFESQTAAVAGTLRVRPADWMYLANTGAYTALFATCCFFGAMLALRRRTL